MMDDNLDYDETPCPQCGHSPTYRCDCPALGCDDGWIDMHEYDDPMLFDEGEEEPCQECLGLGYLHWCPECGYNLNVDHRTMEMIDEAIAAEKLREALSEYVTVHDYCLHLWRPIAVMLPRPPYTMVGPKGADEGLELLAGMFAPTRKGLLGGLP